MRRIQLWATLAIFGLGVLAGGQAEAATNAGVLFLRIAPGARSAAMGEAFVAVADDATATHWNPAGLGGYPLNNEWDEIALPEYGTILDAVAVKNDLPFTDVRAYDLWILTDKGLLVVNPSGDLPDMPTSQDAVGTEGRMGRAVNWVEISTAGVSSDVAAIRRYAQFLSESDAGEIAQQARGTNAGFPIPASVTVLINDFIKPPIRAIGGRGARLYVATGDQLLALERNQWKAVAAPDGSDWATEGINCIEVTSGSRVWIGTDHGLLTRQRGDWERYGTGAGLTSERITDLAMMGQDDGWALTGDGLVHFEGETFTSTRDVTANVGDSLRSMLERFLSTNDPVFLDRAEAEVRSLNGLAPGADPEPGTSVQVPYQLGVRGEITALAYDSFRRLWVGTNLGVSRFSQGQWWVYGYTERVFEQATTAVAVAEQQLGSRATPERSQALAQITIDYNALDADGNIAAGRTIYVYRNPAAAGVHDLAAVGDRLLIGTSTGQLEVKPGDWSRYYHRDLDQDQVRAIVAEGRDAWFITNDRVVRFKKAYTELAFMYSDWLPQFGLDLYYAFFSGVKHVEGLGSLGLSVKFFSYGTIQRTNEFGAPEGVFDSFDGALSLSYGTRLSPALSGGLTGKVIYSRLSDLGTAAELGRGTATAFGFDVGLLYQTPWDPLRLGTTISNLGPNISYIDAQQSDALPRNLATGLALKFIDSPFNRVIVAFDINKEIISLNDRTSELTQIVYNIGGEWTYLNTLSGRLGYVHDHDGDLKHLTAGIGIVFRAGRVDVAYIPSNRDSPLANTLRYSLAARF
jgi:hypothetical protein